ncbi:MAG: hypothetical protein ACK5KQ_00040 [Anaerorhabdus sp.]
MAVGLFSLFMSQDDIIKGAEHDLLQGSAPKIDLETYEISGTTDETFNKWFDEISYEKFKQVWADKDLRKIIESRIRYPYGKHEWLMVGRADKFKEWGISMDDVKSLTSPTSTLKFANPWGIHGGFGSTTAHNEILGLIDSATSYDEYIYMLNEWAMDRLLNGILDLPEGLRR